MSHRPANTRNSRQEIRIKKKIKIKYIVTNQKMNESNRTQHRIKEETFWNQVVGLFPLIASK